MCNREGYAVAVEVFRGSTADPNSLASQIDRVRQNFSISRIVLVDDRGMITEARIEEDLTEISSDEYPGEGLIVYKNPFLRQGRRRKRENLLEANERELAKGSRRLQSGRTGGSRGLRRSVFAWAKC